MIIFTLNALDLIVFLGDMYVMVSGTAQGDSKRNIAQGFPVRASSSVTFQLFVSI